MNRADVADFLGIELRLLNWWTVALRENRRYDEFEIARRSGGPPRVIHAPIKPLKDLQRALLPMVEASYSPKPHVHGFVRERSALTNAAIHRKQRWILRIDLKDFFPSIHFGRVLGVFRAAPFDFPEEVAVALAQICCHQQQLPQGAPTSPVLSNLVCRTMDRELGEIARTAHCHYSRYADDICFSSGRREFPRVLAAKRDGTVVLGAHLRQVIESNDFEINEDKTRLMPTWQRQRVTGVVVNTRLSVPREYTRHLRAVLHIWDRYGPADAEAAFERASPRRNWPPGKAAPEFRLVIRGQLQYLGQVRGYDRVYQRLAAVLAKQDPSFAPTYPRVPEPGDVTYATEGPSDPLHIEAALREMRRVGEFGDLTLRPVPHKPPKGDDQLWNWLQDRTVGPNSTPQVGVFDADSTYARTIGEQGWKHLGNGVVAVVLGRPPWVRDGAPFCIELLYPEEVLRRTDESGRRVFVRSEFDKDGLSHDGQFRMKYPESRTLVVASVTPADGSGESLALSKVAFGEAVGAGQPPYESVDFSGFRPTLERIWRAVAAAQRWCS